MSWWTRLVCVVVAIFVSAGAAIAQDAVERFYRGKTINIYIGSSAGGGSYSVSGEALPRRKPTIHFSASRFATSRSSSM